MKRTLTVALAVVFLLAIAAPVFASNMTYTQDFKADGDIQLERVAGHLCNTGAQWNQIIDGQGELTKVSSITMVEGKITVGDQNDFVTAIDAVRNLTVTSTIQLCAPPKTEWDATNYVYDWYLGVWRATDGGSGVVSPLAYYETSLERFHGTAIGEWYSDYDAPPRWFFSGNRVPAFGRAAGTFLAPGWEAGGWTAAQGGKYLGSVQLPEWREALYAWTTLYGQSLGWSPDIFAGNPINVGEYMPWYNHVLPSKYWEFTQEVVDGHDFGGGVFSDPRDVGDDLWTWGLFDGLGYADGLGVWGVDYSVVTLTELTEQIWSVQVEADPGFSGNLHQKFEAAYGPYERWEADGPPVAFLGLDDEDIAPVHQDAWGFRTDSDGYVTVMVGDDYVGNYFSIEQMARTSQGTVKRNIDISSPWSHAYLSEQSEVVGFSEVQESFAMINLPPGADADAEWWEIF